MKTQIKIFNPTVDSVFELFMNTDLDGPGIEMAVRELMQDIVERIVNTVEQEVFEEDRDYMYISVVEQVHELIKNTVYEYLANRHTNAMQDAILAYKKKIQKQLEG